MVYLRELAESDLPLLNVWRNDSEIIKDLGAPFRFINIETDQKWFQSYLANRQTQIRCAICLENSSEMIGAIYLLGIDSVSRCAELSIMIGNKGKQNQGYGTASIRLMLDHAFNSLNLIRVYLYVLQQNNRAIQVYEKVGFVTEGVLRKSIFKNGEYKDQRLMSVLHNEYKAIRSTLTE